MPHNLSDRQARRLAADIEKFWRDAFLEMNLTTGPAGEKLRAKYEGLDFKKSAAVITYLRGDISKELAGTMGLPNRAEIAEAAEAFGVVMARRELLDLAAAVRRVGL